MLRKMQWKAPEGFKPGERTRVGFPTSVVSDAAWGAFGAGDAARERFESHCATKAVRLVTEEEWAEHAGGMSAIEEIRALKDEVALLKRYIAAKRQDEKDAAGTEREEARKDDRAEASFWDRIAAGMGRGRALLTFTDPLDHRLGRKP